MPTQPSRAGWRSRLEAGSGQAGVRAELCVAGGASHVRCDSSGHDPSAQPARLPLAAVCNDAFDDAAAKAVCKMLGKAGGKAVKNTNGAQYGSETAGLPIILDQISCETSASGLNDCVRTTTHHAHCTHAMEVGVECEEPGALPSGQAGAGGVEHGSAGALCRQAGRLLTFHPNLLPFAPSGCSPCMLEHSPSQQRVLRELRPDHGGAGGVPRQRHALQGGGPMPLVSPAGAGQGSCSSPACSAPPPQTTFSSPLCSLMPQPSSGCARTQHTLLGPSEQTARCAASL